VSLIDFLLTGRNKEAYSNYEESIKNSETKSPFAMGPKLLKKTLWIFHAMFTRDSLNFAVRYANDRSRGYSR